jgi:uncharacterized protein
VQTGSMAFGVSIAELLWLALAILSAGIVTGLFAGLFGIGGGAIIVPVLFEVFRLFDVPDQVRMQLCIGTSLAIIIPTTIRSYLAHRASGHSPGHPPLDLTRQVGGGRGSGCGGTCPFF